MLLLLIASLALQMLLFLLLTSSLTPPAPFLLLLIVSLTAGLLLLFFYSIPCPNRTVSPVVNSLPTPSNTVVPIANSSPAPPMLLPCFYQPHSPLSHCYSMLLTTSLVSPTLSGISSIGFVGTIKNNTSTCIFLCLYFAFYLRILCMLKIAYVVEYFWAIILFS